MTSFIGIVFALAASLFYGTGDFAGGVAARKLNQFQVLVISSGISVFPMLAMVFLTGERMPDTASLVWAALAGLTGCLGMALLYRGLAQSGAAVVSPVAGVVGAAVPLVYGSFAEGLPAAPKLAGFLLALIGIWLVAKPHPASLPNHGQGLAIGLVSGISFGAFFIFIAQVQHGAVFVPLTVARFVTVPFVLLIVASRRLPLPSVTRHPAALVAGVLDVAANASFMLARQYTRLDVAAVLSSLYPAVTVVLARLVYKEVISRTQWVGLLLCLAAIGLIVY